MRYPYLFWKNRIDKKFIILSCDLFTLPLSLYFYFFLFFYSRFPFRSFLKTVLLRVISILNESTEFCPSFLEISTLLPHFCLLLYNRLYLSPFFVIKRFWRYKLNQKLIQFHDSTNFPPDWICCQTIEKKIVTVPFPYKIDFLPFPLKLLIR